MKLTVIILASLCALLLIIIFIILTAALDLYEDFQAGKYCSEECPYVVRPEKSEDDE